jgi:hypothetical protein
MIISKNTEWAVEYEGEQVRSTEEETQTPSALEAAHARQ